MVPQHGQQMVAGSAPHVHRKARGPTVLFDLPRTAHPAGFRRAQRNVYDRLFFGGGLGGRQVKVHLILQILFDTDGGRFEL